MGVSIRFGAFFLPSLEPWGRSGVGAGVGVSARYGCGRGGG